MIHQSWNPPGALDSLMLQGLGAVLRLGDYCDITWGSRDSARGPQRFGFFDGLFFVGKTPRLFHFSVVIVVITTTTSIIFIIIIQSLMRDGLMHTRGSWWCCMIKGWLEQISWLSEVDQKVLEHDRKSLTHVGVYITFKVKIRPQNLLWPFGWFVPWWARC